MQVTIFSTRRHDRETFAAANAASGHALSFLEPRLGLETARLAEGAEAVCLFVNDDASAAVIAELRALGVRLIALRSAGFNHVDLAAAAEAGIAVARVPAYSPHAVAEHTVALMLTLNRHIHRAWARVREGNFLLDGLMGFDMNGKTVGVVGTGEIGLITARILAGFGCELLGHDPQLNPQAVALGLRYVDLEALAARSDIITLHCPLTPETRHLVNAELIARMRSGVMLVNSSRGAVIDTRAVIEGLKSGQIGALALDVYEEEGDLFFADLSDEVIQDDVFARLLTFPNVLITGHQAFFTREAIAAIAETTIANLDEYEAKGAPLHPVSLERVVPAGQLSPRPRP
jgi:D-lactate dehydrogenase